MSENFGALSNPRRTSFRQNSFSTSSRTLYYLAIQTIWPCMAMLRLRKSLLKAQKNVILDFEQEFIDEVGQFFCWGCSTLPRKMCKKKFTKIFTKIFSRIFQSQKLERQQIMQYLLTETFYNQFLENTIRILDHQINPTNNFRAYPYMLN